MSAEPEPLRFVLADLPADAVRPNLSAARPLGSRAALSARLKELLPGASFDDDGHGVFKRAGYTIRIALEEAEPVVIHVDVDRADGLAALKRVTGKTTWRAVDPDALAFIDLDASRAAGAIVFLGPAEEAPLSTGGGGGFRPIKVGAATAVIAGLVVFQVWWMNRPAPPTLDPRSTQRMIDEMIQRIGDAQRVQMAYMKSVSPAFRANPVVAQLFLFDMAQVRYTSGFGMGRFAKPERLTDTELWERFRMPPPLPPQFAEFQRGGYQFDFMGETCGPMKGNMSAPENDCDGFVYAARPIDEPGAPKGRFAFALFTQDGKIHYRKDGDMPLADDPTVDNVEASSHADLVNGGGPEPPGIVSRFRAATMAFIERLMGNKPGSTEVNAAESGALKDLRAVAAAENEFSAMAAGTYVPPEVLADPKMFAPIKMAPLLPGYFAQSVRLGYAFEFSGDAHPVGFGSFDWISPQYTWFVYVARPVQPGPPGRRTLAVYPDGVVFATNEDRVPTRQDTALGTQ